MRNKLLLSSVYSYKTYVPEKKKTDSRKRYPTLPGWPTCACSDGKRSSHIGGVPAKSSEIPPRRAGSLLT